jgi:hypothetical protein
VPLPFHLPLSKDEKVAGKEGRKYASRKKVRKVKERTKRRVVGRARGEAME